MFKPVCTLLAIFMSFPLYNSYSLWFSCLCSLLLSSSSFLPSSGHTRCSLPFWALLSRALSFLEALATSDPYLRLLSLCWLPSSCCARCLFTTFSSFVLSGFLTLWLQLHCAVYSPKKYIADVLHNHSMGGNISVTITACFVFALRTCIIISNVTRKYMCSVCNSVAFAPSMCNMLKLNTQTHGWTNFHWTIKCGALSRSPSI